MAAKPTYDELIQTIKRLEKEVSDCKQTAEMMGESRLLVEANKRLQREVDERQRIETALRESEARYHSLFQNAPTSLSDTSERALAEAALKESEAKFRTLTENSPNMIFINRQGKVVYTNKRCEEIMGFTRDEFYAPDFNFLTLIAPESMELVKSNFMKHMQGEDLEPYEYTLVNKEGRRIEALITSKLIDYEGARAILGIVTDISQRKQAEEALQASESKFRSFFDLSPQSVARIDFETGRIVDVNQKFGELFKYPKAEILGRTMLDLGLCSEEQNRTLLDALMETGRFDGLEMDLTARDGTVLTTLLFAQTVPIKGDHSILIIFNDITKRKKLEKQLQQVRRMEALGTLAGGIAHDFNNLLMGILGNASLMMSDMDSHDPSREQLKNIETYVRSAAELTKQLLGFARGGKYEVQPTNLNDLIERSARMFGRTKKEIRIHKRFEDDLWIVAVDAGQIDQMLLNLYVNAWQAMAGGGDLYIQTENVILDQNYVKPFTVEAGKYVKISITDTGVGMDEATRQRIFEPFFTTQEMGRGTGLGLASAYGIIKNHGGIINVYSEKGEGTTFSIYLPACDADVALEADLDEEMLKGNETVLLVDDEDMIIEIGQNLLEKMGYLTLVARGGQEAFDIYREKMEKIDLVILDMIMPDMNGQETYDNLKMVNPDVKVLLSSGYSLNDQARKIMDSGCNGFIQKPYDAVKLSQKIREILDPT